MEEQVVRLPCSTEPRKYEPPPRYNEILAARLQLAACAAVTSGAWSASASTELDRAILAAEATAVPR